MTLDLQANNPQHDVVDLRSDTVTRPTPEMYEAILKAPLGDDVLGDDPTVMRLEELAAELLDLEAALFVPSGTMGNQIAIACQTERGDAILAEEESHIVYYECGAPGVIAGVVTWTLPSKHGVMDPHAVEAHVLKRTLHTPGTTLLCVENTHNRAGGTVVPLDTLRAYREICDRNGMKLHLDGARVFNAAVALDLDVSDIAKFADSVSFCLSKGLGAPVGSMLCGSQKLVEDARKWRKRLGGGMRQSGILAACGIVSLSQSIENLAEDHRRARALASGIQDLPGIEFDWDTVQTNMVLLRTEAPASEWLENLRERNVWALDNSPNHVRLVLHSDIDDDKVNRAIEAFGGCAAAIA